MKRYVIFLVLLLIVLSPGFSQTIYADDSTFNDILGEKTAFVYFYAEWCPFCHDFTPIYKDIASDYDEYDFIMVDIDKSPEVYNSYGYGVPSVVFFKEGSYENSFDSNFSRTSFEKWCRNNLGMDSSSSSHSNQGIDLEFIATNATEWEVYFPSSKESHNAIILEMNEDRIVYLYTIDFGTDDNPDLYCFVHVWDRYGESFWAYSFNLKEKGRKKMEKIQAGLYKFTSRKLDKHNEDLWSVSYLIDKGAYIDKTELKAH